MITRVFASNFRTLINFDVGLESLTLLLGPNGAGKTSIFEVIRLVRDFQRGEPIWVDGTLVNPTTTSLFPDSTRCRWQDVAIQTFEIVMNGQGGEFVYRLEIEHDASRERCRVQSEKLAFDGRPLFESTLHDNQLTAQLYRDDGSRGPTGFADWTRSTLPSIQPRPENKLMTWFKQRMGRVIVTRFNPAVIGARAEEENQTLNWDASNFVAWFRHVANLDLELVAKLRPQLQEVITGLVGLSLDPDGAEAKVLKAKFRAGAPRALQRISPSSAAWTSCLTGSAYCLCFTRCSWLPTAKTRSVSMSLRTLSPFAKSILG
jgi:hypothetical protein